MPYLVVFRDVFNRIDFFKDPPSELVTLFFRILSKAFDAIDQNLSFKGLTVISKLFSPYIKSLV